MKLLALRERELLPYQAAEDQWGEHPERPIELLADGSVVWRVPPGAVCATVFGVNVKLIDPTQHPQYRLGLYWVPVERCDTGARVQVLWTELRRIGYPLDARAQEVRQASHAAG